MSYEREYAAFLENQKKGRSGESLRRLQEGHGYLEQLFLQQVWWPAVGSFEHLFAEYEVSGVLHGFRFLDFAYLRPPYRLCFELDGFGTHAKDLNRWQFADQLQRQNQLMFDDWKVFRFALDDVKEKPQRCQQFIQQLLGKYYGSALDSPHLNRKERQLLQFFVHHGQQVTPSAAATFLQVSRVHTRRILGSLHSKGVIVPYAGKERIRSYVLNPDNGRVRLD
ncbi:DNA-binding response regulator [Paenibacillus sp. YN15]|uniref:DNA-binding response regulator n=1 Tax=Paenibacillus sp. YN15 TaxID=1742774 RepID=UPI000DCD0789|nr:DNA-binding response regulator [Paenibacillus sp. YN15]RAV06424.1 DNA-binding response regulator [Paenibacillus sp. YN15]